MKKLSTAVLALFILQYCLAQIEKGSFLIGGDATASSSKTDVGNTETKSKSVALNSKAGYFVDDKLCFGLMVPLSLQKDEFENDNSNYDATSKTWGVGAFVRYYYPIKKVQIISELSYAHNKLNSKTPYFDPILGSMSYTKFKSKGKTFQASAGLGMFLGKNAGIELLLNYQNVYNDIGTYDYTGYSEKNRFFLSIGFQYYLTKKNERIV